MMDAAPMFSIPNPALLLSRSDVVRLMNTHDYLHAVEAAFRSHAGGGAHMPLPVHIPVEAGGFHAKGARIVLDRVYVALKLNANFPGNPHTKGLPTIQGVVLLCDASDGSLLAVMDSIEITLRRTAAASALAARFLARKDAHRIAVCGCGEQGRAQLVALAQVMPLEMARVWDVDADKASAFARDMGEALHLDVRAVKEAADATRASDVIVTATSARTPYLTRDMVAPGTFVAAVGADSPDKSELAPGLMARAKIVVDVLEQCVVMGDLRHAIAAGMVAPGDVHATLGELAAGRRRGRTDRDEIFVFDSTGTGLQDAASAAWIYQRARAGNIGTSIVFAH